MLEQFFIWQDLLAALVRMAALELDFAQQVPCHSINSIELTLFPAVGACVWILLEPMILAVDAERLLADFALNWVFEHVVADSANQFG